MKIVCTRCQQDWIKRVNVGALNNIIYLCYECEATWESEDFIHSKVFLQLEVYMEQEGLEYSNKTFDSFKDDVEWFG